MDDFKVTPWEVKGEIDYNRLIKQFGLKIIDDELKEKIKSTVGELHYTLERNIYFVHRDFEKLLDEYNKGNKFYLYSGRGPSGNVHLGHVSAWLLLKWIQEKFQVPLIFQLTDDEKFLFKDNLSLKETNRLAYENALDFMGLGFDSKLTRFIIDSEHISMLYPNALKIADKINFSNVKATFGLDDSSSIGKIFFTAIQATPAMLLSELNGADLRALIPCAVDQDPHFRIARDVLPKLGYKKPSLLESKLLPGLKGAKGNKMSSSDENSAIYVNDSKKEVKRKIMKYAFSGGKPTLEEHRKEGGNPDIDIAYQYIYFFEEDTKKVKELYDGYKSGKILTGEMKQIAVDTINDFLENFRENRKKFEGKIDKLLFKKGDFKNIK
ncbi:MAG: tryptophan--tRNA ligase [Candidatus Woesearchaeota archaeon]